MNIILILVDALRFDHLSCYSSKNPTPNIDKLANKGMIFDNTFATSCWSFPSIASLFTGLLPRQHMAYYHSDDMKADDLYIDEKHQTLAEKLSDNFKTFGISGADFICKERGFARGFDQFVPAYGKTKNTIGQKLHRLLKGYDNNAYYTVQHVKKWIRKNNESFIFADLQSPHFVYKPPKPFNPFLSFVPKGNTLEERYQYMGRQLELTNLDFAGLNMLYDGEIRYVDYRIGQIVEPLMSKDNLIIVTSDHGECFGEHRLLDHEFCLYDTLIHIPLIIYHPSLEAKRISELVSNADLFKMIVNFTETSKINIPNRGHIEAQYGKPKDLLDLFKKFCPGFDYSKFKRGFRCERTLDTKQIWATDGTKEVYNIRDDPKELNNLEAEDER